MYLSDMKKIFLILFLSSSFIYGQTSIPDDTSSVDNIIKGLYHVISGPAGERNWGRFKNLFTAEAKMGVTVTNKEGVDMYRSFSPDEYIEKNGPYLLTHDFTEKEIARNIQSFGNLVHVFSTYEFISGTDKARGINSIQLVYQKSRWYIASIIWQAENEAFKLPEKYLKNQD